MSVARDAAVYSRLTGGTAITSLLGGTAEIYNGVAEDATYPAIIFQLQAGTDDNDNPHRAQQAVYSIKAVSQESFEEASLIDAQVDAAFHGHPLTISGWSNFWMVRESEFQFTLVDEDSRRYWHVGGLYRVRTAT